MSVPNDDLVLDCEIRDWERFSQGWYKILRQTFLRLVEIERYPAIFEPICKRGTHGGGCNGDNDAQVVHRV